MTTLRAAAFALPFLAAPAFAQDDRDPGFLAGLIEDNLSAPGLSVQIDGFSGALSSEASIEELRIADDQGTWLVARDLVLDWNRSALLRGRLEVVELTAGLIQLDRAPLPAEGIEPPPAAAGGFSLPELPVSVDIQRIAADRIQLGAPLLGQEIALTLEASARLIDGSAQTTIQAERLDGPTGVFSIEGSFSGGETPELALDLDIREAQGGLAATLLSLPGAPALDLTVQGAGPLDAFAADIRLASDGQERLGGRVALTGVDEGRRFDVDLSGDVTELFAPRYKPFFGEDVALIARGLQGDDGRLSLDTLNLATQALNLSGSARLDAEGWPEFLDITGALAAADGTPVLLPTSDPIRLLRADFALAHDAAIGPDWRLDLDLADFVQDAVTLATGRIGANGQLTRDGGTVTGATAAIEAALQGLDFTDPALADAVGAGVTLTGDVTWRDETPLQISDLALEGDGYRLNGSLGLLETADENAGLPATLDLRAALDDLSRYAALAGLDLSGDAELRATGAVDALAGTFDLRLDGQTNDVALGIAQADPLLAGRTTLDLAARRSLDGTFLDGLTLRNDQLSLNGSAAIYGEETEARARGETGAARLDARLNDGAPLDPRLAGPITLSTDLTQAADGAWSGTVQAAAPQGVTLSAEGRLTGDAPDLQFQAAVPDISAFVPDVPGGAQLSGRAFARQGTWSLEADVAGPWDLTVSVSGPVTGPSPRIAFEAALPDLTGPVPALADIPPLNTGITLSGALSQSQDRWSIDAQTETGSGITAQVSGPVTQGLDIALVARVPQVQAFSPALEGRTPLEGAADLTGTLRQAGEAFSVDLVLDTDGGAQVTASGPVTGPAPRVAYTVSVPDLTGLDPALTAFDALQGPATIEGTAEQTGGDWSVDTTLNAPSGVTARARGPVTGDGAPNLAVALTVPQVQDFVPAVEGALSVDGTVAQTPDGLAIDANARGPYQSRATVQTVLNDALTADFTLAIPSLAPLAPVPGGLDVSGQARQVEGGFEVDVAGTGPYAARFDASADTVDGLSVSAQGQVPDASALAPQLRGPIDFDVSADQQGEAWTVDADVSGGQAINATVQGVATGPQADLTFEASIGNVAAFAPGLSGPLNTSGSLRAQGDGYAYEVQASGPLNAVLDASGTIQGGAPTAQFDLRVPDIGPLVPDLSGPLRATGTAAQQGDGFAIDVDLTGPGGTTASVAGTAGSTLNLDIRGQAPLGLANAVLAPNRIAGTATFDLAVNGPPGLDAVSGTIRTAGTALSLPALRNGLDDINATIALSGAQARIDLSAAPQTGGVLTVTGPVALAAPFNGDLAIRFDGRLEDPSLYTARVIAEIGVTGPLAGGARVAGDILLDEAEVSVPSTGLTAVGELPPIRHVRVPRPVQRTLERAGREPGGAAAGGGATGAPGPAYPLAITVRAPNRIFVRGRGLDAELGGQLQIGGTTANPVIAGGFELARGRLDILQQRFDLDEGSVTFQGTLVPFIRLVAITEADALTASIIVQGPATAPEVSFESSPSVPQEEILAQIFFGRDLASLSPLQALQLANSIATLAGRGSGGLLESLRGNAGLDDLDLTTDADGNTAIRAGKYISDNVYTDVQIDQEGSPRVSLNIDLSPSLTVRGATGASGDTSIGLFFERDY